MGQEQPVEVKEEVRVNPKMIPPHSITERELKEEVLADLATQDDLAEYATTTAMTAAIATAVATLTTSIAAVPKVKVLTFSRDMTAASGDVTYTGTDFTSKLLIVIGSFTGGTIKSSSVGGTDGTTTFCKSIDNAGNTSFTGDTIVAWDTYPTKNQGGTISSITSTGFVITWTKASTPSAGTFHFSVICIG